MKYQQEYIIGRKTSDRPLRQELRVLRVPITEKDGRWVPAGEPIEDTWRRTQESLFVSISEYDACGSTCPEAVPFTPPEGWSVLAEFRLPPDYVPPSSEVTEEEQRRAVEYLRKMGVWRDPK